MNLIVVGYTVSFIASFLILIAALFVFNNKISLYYHLLFISIAITALGFFQSTGAQDAKSALSAIQLSYFGAIFSPILNYLCFSELCQHKPNKFFVVTLTLTAIAIYACIFFVEYTSLYYKSYYTVNIHGLCVLKKTYGPLHNLYYAYVTITSMSGLFIIGKSFSRKHEVSFMTSIPLVVTMILAAVSYGIQNILKASISFTPFVNLISESIIIMLLLRIRMYDVQDLASEYIEATNIDGFMLFDIHGRYLGSDKKAKEWFPEISTLRMDRRIPENTSKFMDKISDWLINGTITYEYFNSQDRIISAKYHQFENMGRKVKIIHLVDETPQQKYAKLIEEYNTRLEKAVSEKTDQLKNIQNDILVSMAIIVENRDTNTGGHIARTSDIVRIFVSRLKELRKYPELTKEFSEHVVKAAPLHDFGKIAIPDEILNKPGKFTDKEYEVMKQHSEKGAAIVEKILRNSNDPDFMTVAVNVAYFHHERWNGTGYPKGLKGTDIPFEARIMALADVFDALVSRRVYKERFDYDKAFSIMKESSGSHFDPELCADFINCRPDLELLYETYEKQEPSFNNTVVLS